MLFCRVKFLHCRLLHVYIPIALVTDIIPEHYSWTLFLDIIPEHYSWTLFLNIIPGHYSWTLFLNIIPEHVTINWRIYKIVYSKIFLWLKFWNIFVYVDQLLKAMFISLSMAALCDIWRAGRKYTLPVAAYVLSVLLVTACFGFWKKPWSWH